MGKGSASQDMDGINEWYASNLHRISRNLEHLRHLRDGILFERESPINRIFVIKKGNQIQLYFTDKKSRETPKLSGIMSRIDLDTPLTLLGFYASVMMLTLVWKDHPKSVYVLGFGGGRIPMVFHHYFPSVDIDSTEVDSMIVDISKRYFAIEKDDRINIYATDGRDFLTKLSDTKRYDILLIDAYGGSGTHPYHLSTIEFYELCKRHVASNGVLATNLVEDDLLFQEKAATFVQSFNVVHEFSRNGTHVFFGSNANEQRIENLVQKATDIEDRYRFGFPFKDLALDIHMIKNSRIDRSEYRQFKALHDVPHAL